MKRLFYPRGIHLSEDFVDAFHREYDRLIDEGINPKTLINRFNKALQFHVNEKRRYTDNVVEAAGSAKAVVDSAEARKKHKMDDKPKEDKKSKDAVDPRTGLKVGSKEWEAEEKAKSLDPAHHSNPYD